jgi:hypothetical protein
MASCTIHLRIQACRTKPTNVGRKTPTSAPAQALPPKGLSAFAPRPAGTSLKVVRRCDSPRGSGPPHADCGQDRTMNPDRVSQLGITAQDVVAAIEQQNIEFAKEQREAGMGILEAAMAGARLRFRAVLMTAFAFILGVLPLVVATGAGAASRRAIGTTVFSGMLAGTLVGILLIPGLFVLFQAMRERARTWRR